MSFLNLFGGDKSESSSTTTQTTTTQNAATFATEGGTAVTNNVNGNGNTSNFSIYNENLSDDVAIRAMDNMLTMGQDALLFGHDAQKQAYGFASESQKSSLQFADAQVQRSNALTNSAIGGARDAYESALAYGSRQTGIAIDSLTKQSTQLDKAYADAKGVLSQNVVMFAIGAGVLVLYFATRKK